MEALLRQSRNMCPFLQKTSPATLRTLSTSTRHASPGGGTISNLQVLARRCPVMGKALAVQSVQSNAAGLSGLGGVFGGTRGYKSKANIHTTGARHATVVPEVLRRDEGM
jgi:5-aminolevulinate synthase